jgi:alpha-1,3-rhamnosyl/mannosyltransferase
MQIGVDATCWQNKRGYGRHSRALLQALVRLDTANHYTFFMDSSQGNEQFPSQVQVRTVSASKPTALAAAANGRRTLGDMWRMSRALSSRGFDLLLFPTVYSYVPVWSRAKKIVMIHDVIAEKYPHLTLPSRTAQLFWQAKVALGRRQADALVTVSDYSRQGIAEYYQLAPSQIFTVSEASDPIFRMLPTVELSPELRALGIEPDRRQVVYVGGFGPHKNLAMLVDAFAQVCAQPEFADLRLVLVGEYKREVFHSVFGAIEQQVAALGLTDRVIFTGYLSDEQLVILLNLATVLVLPSLIEGFGLPAVEAAACGCPVIATTWEAAAQQMMAVIQHVGAQ